MPGKHGDVLERMASKFVFDPSGCWLWTAAKNTNGYGVIGVESHDGVMPNRQAYRVMYEILRGPIPEGLEPDHLCRVRLCINPDHLELVTHRENLRRGEGWAGKNSRKTHCPQGHEYTEENTVPNGSNGRRCRICRDEYMRRYARKRRSGNER